MENKLRSVLHLYTGQRCECYWTDSETSPPTDFENEATIISVHANYKNGDKPWPVRVDAEIRNKKGEFQYGVERYYYFNSIKLILTHISDLNEDQKNTIEEIIGVINADNFIDAFVNKRTYSISIHKMVELVNTLRGMGVDMDGLIEEGLAVDKKTLKQKPVLAE